LDWVGIPSARCGQGLAARADGFLNDLNNSEEEVTEFMNAQSKKKSCVSSGFTLIELLVVIAIIAR